MAGKGNPDAALVAALAAGSTLEAAARAAGRSVRTVCRRMEDPAFRRRVDEARAVLLDRALGKLADGATLAVGTLVDLLAPGVPPAVRRSAAASLLEKLVAIREHTEFETRLAALEARLDAIGGMDDAPTS